MGLRLAPSALANACFLAALAGPLTHSAGSSAQEPSNAPAVTNVAPATPAAASPTASAPARTTAPATRAAEAGRGDQGPIALHWVRLPDTERCIAGDALARKVESKLRRSVFPAARDASILIEGHVRKTDSGYAAELQMRDRSGKALGSRELSSQDESCTELSDTLAVVLAVMIDPDAARHAASVAPEVEKPAPKEVARSEDGDDDRLLAFGRAVFAVTERPLLGFGSAYERALGRAGGLRVEVALFAENGTPVDLGSGDGPEPLALVRVTYAGAAYCPLWLTFTRTRLIGCAGLELGGVRGHDANFPAVDGRQSPPDRLVFWASASASLRLSIEIVGPLEVHLAAGLLSAFGDGLDVVRRNEERQRILPRGASQLGALLDLGLGARF